MLEGIISRLCNDIRLAMTDFVKAATPENFRAVICNSESRDPGTWSHRV